MTFFENFLAPLECQASTRGSLVWMFTNTAEEIGHTQLQGAKS